MQSYTNIVNITTNNSNLRDICMKNLEIMTLFLTIIAEKFLKMKIVQAHVTHPFLERGKIFLK